MTLGQAMGRIRTELQTRAPSELLLRSTPPLQSHGAQTFSRARRRTQACVQCSPHLLAQLSRTVGGREQVIPTHNPH